MKQIANMPMRNKKRDASVCGASKVSSLISVWEGNDNEDEQRVPSLLSLWDESNINSEEEDDEYLFASLRTQKKWHKAEED